MNMTEQEVRTLVREAIERYLGRPQIANSQLTMANFNAHPSHASHILLPVLPGSELDEGACVIEPAVHCSHCGFCRSYGH